MHLDRGKRGIGRATHRLHCERQLRRRAGRRRRVELDKEIGDFGNEGAHRLRTGLGAHGQHGCHLTICIRARGRDAQRAVAGRALSGNICVVNSTWENLHLAIGYGHIAENQAVLVNHSQVGKRVRIVLVALQPSPPAISGKVGALHKDRRFKAVPELYLPIIGPAARLAGDNDEVRRG